MRELILKHFREASNSDISDGMRWYRDAHLYCKTISNKYNLPLYKAVAMLAVLSPRNKWERNKQDLVNVILYRDKAVCGTFNQNKDKAIKILDAKNEEEVTNLVSSIKCYNFFINIYKPNMTGFVTVDVWAMRSVDFDGNLTEKRYNDIKRAYIDASKELSILPHELQAIVWTKIRSA